MESFYDSGFISVVSRIFGTAFSLLTSLVIFLLIIYILVPTVFYFLPTTMQRIFFLNFVKVPGIDYADLTSHGVRFRGRNFYLHLESITSKSKKFEDSSIGVWHILPRSLSESLVQKEIEGVQSSDQEIEEMLEMDHHGIFLYFHGNSFDRTQFHRTRIYNMLSELNFHVLAIDYRGYGDSNGVPNEDAVVEDAHAIVKYAIQRAPSKDIFIWGHSMGTGVATRVVAELSDSGRHPRALILESPFNNLVDVIKNHPLSRPFRFLPWFENTVIKPLMKAGLNMSSDDRIKRIKCPIMVLHSEDDHIIPIKLARKLVEAGRKAGREIEFREFDAGKNYYHKCLHMAPELPTLISDFVTKTQIVSRSKNRKASYVDENGEPLHEYD